MKKDYNNTSKKKDSFSKKEVPGKSSFQKDSPKKRTSSKTDSWRNAAKKADSIKETSKNKDSRRPEAKKDVSKKDTFKKNPATPSAQKAFQLPKMTSDSKNSKCPYSKKCGGCQFIDLPYEEQLKNKQKAISKLLNSFCKVNPIIGMKDPYHYRNKVHGVVASDRKGNCFTGIYEEKTHHVIRVDSCWLEDQKADAIMQSVVKLMKSFKMKPYNEDTGYGFLRHILIRTGHETGQILVVLITASPVFPSKNNFVKALRQEHPEITSIVVNVNNRNTSMVLGDKEQILYGKGYIEDVLCGKRFRISPKSFYQVNPVQTEVLYNKAIEFAELTGKETVIDAYSGIGTIGLIASAEAKEVISVELNGDAVKDAIANAKLNSIHNVKFYKADASDFMVNMAEQKQKADVVFMDPPRAGSDQRFMNAIFKLKPKKVVYVSCNPETLKRDLNYMTSHGYQVKKVQPVDMFAHTEHCECVTLLVRN